MTKSYSIPFGYLNKTDVYVTINGEPVEFSWITQGNIELKQAPESGATIKIYRDTPVIEPIVDYVDGSIISENDLDLPVLQNMYVAQEIKDTANDAVDVTVKANAKSEEALNTSNSALTLALEAKSTAELSKSISLTATEIANESKEVSQNALDSIEPAVARNVDSKLESMNIPQIISDDVDTKIEDLKLDEKIVSEVREAINGVEIPGLTKETICGALSYTPYDAETNDKDFATSEDVAQAISTIPPQVNADWNATEGPAQILNKPELSEVAVSGNYEDLKGKPENLATTEDIAVLQEEIAKKGIPVGMVEYFAMSAPPPGYLMADGTAVGRETYPDLFAAIGTVFGEGDGVTTFNLPDLIGRFAQGSDMPGQKVKAGLPNITGTLGFMGGGGVREVGGAFYASDGGVSYVHNTATINVAVAGFSAGLSNPVYGASNTVQPPALTLLPCIKAFDAATNPGLIDITELANEKANKTQVANLAMPSNSYTQLTLPTNPSSFTAPADGYFFSTAYAGTLAGFINFSNTNGMGNMAGVSAGNAVKIFLPVKKGDIVSVNYGNLIEQTTVGFFYCEGSQP